MRLSPAAPMAPSPPPLARAVLRRRPRPAVPRRTSSSRSHGGPKSGRSPLRSGDHRIWWSAARSGRFCPPSRCLHLAPASESDPPLPWTLCARSGAVGDADPPLALTPRVGRFPSPRQRPRGPTPPRPRPGPPQRLPPRPGPRPAPAPLRSSRPPPAWAEAHSEFRKRSECEDPFDYVGSSYSWIRSSSKRDLRFVISKDAT